MNARNLKCTTENVESLLAANRIGAAKRVQANCLAAGYAFEADVVRAIITRETRV